MQPAGVRRRRGAGIGDLDRNGERVGAQPVFDRERESKRIDCARARIVVEDEPGEIGRRRLDGEGLEPREAVEREGIGAPIDPLLAVARPADHRIEDRTDFAPDRRIAGPHQLAPAGPPLPRLGAEERDRRLRVAVDERDPGHGATPSKAAAAIRASLTPGADATSALPLVRPSPVRKSLT